MYPAQSLYIVMTRTEATRSVNVYLDNIHVVILWFSTLHSKPEQDLTSFLQTIDIEHLTLGRVNSVDDKEQLDERLRVWRYPLERIVNIRYCHRIILR